MRTNLFLSLTLVAGLVSTGTAPARAEGARAGSAPVITNESPPPSKGNFSRASRELPAPPSTEKDSSKSDVEIELRRQVELAKLYSFKRGPRFSMIGEVKTENGNAFSINGEFFKVGSEAAINGSIGNGTFAEVSGPFKAGEMKVADSVVILDPAAAAAPQPSTRRSYTHSGSSQSIGPNSKSGRER